MKQISAITLPQGLLDRLLQIDQLRDLWRRAMNRTHGSIHERVLAELELQVESIGDLERIPKQGPLVIVANHPFGIVEGPALGALLDRVRPDVKFITNSLLAELPELRERIFAVNPSGDAAYENTSAIRSAFRHLRNGGALVVFPAGQVSAMRPPTGVVSDAEWQPMAARLAIKTGARVLPIFFAGRNRSRFQLAGLLHPALRTMMLASEMLSRRRQTIRIVVGHANTVQKFRNAEALTTHLRAATYRLASQVRQVPVAAAHGTNALALEIAALTPIIETGSYRLYLEKAAQIPLALEEIGRLREMTFRAAGEGTGRDRDLDSFDRQYWHLFLWQSEAQEIAGAYRISDGAEGASSYCKTLFHFPRHWGAITRQSAELGRSFICAPYQRDFLPLLMLWKGIGRFVMDRPHIRYLLGSVSVSADYTPAARALIAGSLGDWRAGIRPRNLLTFALAWRPGIRPVKVSGDLEVLCKQVEELEPDGKGLPVLLRQYTNLGGEVLCMNLDPRFNNALDGLVLLDLHRVPPRMMQRYFGAEGVRRFCPLPAPPSKHDMRPLREK